MVTARYLLDTDALSEPIRPKPDRRFMLKFEQYAKLLAISSVTWHEALFGARRLPEGRRRSEIETYLHDVIAACLPILPYDRAAAVWHADERAKLDAEGTAPPFADGQIASIAATRGLVLVTRNTQDYARFQSLTVEDWTRVRGTSRG